MLRNVLRQSFLLPLCCVLLLAVGMPQYAAAEGSPPSAGSTPSATLPLAEVLRLYKENQAKAEPKDVRPDDGGAVKTGWHRG